MSLPSIAIINFSAFLSDQDVQNAIRAVNRQVTEDFIPLWGNGRLLRLHETIFDPATSSQIGDERVMADSVIYIVDEAFVPGALGFHDLNAHEVPFGFVFLTDDWTTTLSHEVLELIVDPTVNIFVPGPDPRGGNNVVLHTYETCDAVERTGYEIDGVRVSNFVTPTYFSIGDAQGTRNDFLGVGVPSFGVTPGSHLAFFDLNSNTFEQVIGSQAPQLARQARRLRQHDRAKPERPCDVALEEMLAAYNESPADGGKGLGQMRAMSRTARYQASALSMMKN